MVFVRPVLATHSLDATVPRGGTLREPFQRCLSQSRIADVNTERVNNAAAGSFLSPGLLGSHPEVGLGVLGGAEALGRGGTPVEHMAWDHKS